MVKRALVITSIANDLNPVLRQFANECRRENVRFIVIGDSKSPSEFHIDGCEFYDLQKQRSLDFNFAHLVPERHYSRKNIGYLLAMSSGSERIIETDDDNYPLDDFWKSSERQAKARKLDGAGWVNVYRFFSKEIIWPRGFPLEFIRSENRQEPSSELTLVDCPVQQGLADENPDVDAVYRLTYPLPFRFDKESPVALGKNSWCPFNSQNTIWFKEAYPLLYLPSHCSFRMTDIWRSFVVQRIAWEYNWYLLFYAPTVYQDRNDHSLLRDFDDEVSGYLNNDAISRKLQSVKLSSSASGIFDNLKKCYDAIIEMGLIKSDESILLEAWCSDVKNILK